MEYDPLAVLSRQLLGIKEGHRHQQSAFDVFEHVFLRGAYVDQNNFVLVECGLHLVHGPRFEHAVFSIFGLHGHSLLRSSSLEF